MLQYRKYFYILSGTLLAGSVISLFVFGLSFGTDFKGGSMMEIAFEGERPSHDAAQKALGDFNLGEVVVQDIEEKGLILRFGEISAEVHGEVLKKLETLGQLKERRFESVGPLIGEEVKRKSFWAIGLVVLMIVGYIAWAFRRVSFPVPSWVYSAAGVLALFHDVFITVGAFSLISVFSPMEVGVPFIAALLTIFGYSINDTIIVFDRIRENVLREGSVFDFGEVIDKSVRQTFARSFNTSFSTLLALFAVFLFGGETISSFALTLMIGITVGTYSSLFIASPLLFSWYMLKAKR